MMPATTPRITAPAAPAAGASAIGAARAGDDFSAALAAAGGKRGTATGERLEAPADRSKPIKLDPAATAEATQSDETAHPSVVEEGAGSAIAAEANTGEVVEADIKAAEAQLPEGLAALLASLLPGSTATPSTPAGADAVADHAIGSADDILQGAANSATTVHGAAAVLDQTQMLADEAALVDVVGPDAATPALDVKTLAAQAGTAKAVTGSQGTQDVLRQLALQAGMAPAEDSGLRNPSTLEGNILSSSGALSGTAAQQNAQLAAASANPTTEQALRSPVATPRWADELGSRMVLMATRGTHEGSLTLTPEHLGPLEVRINVNHNTTNVWFGAQHADTRAALTEALPRLREMFAEAGLSLGQADVSQQAPRQESAASPMRDVAASGEIEELAVVDTRRTLRSLTSGLLDLYA